MSVKRFYLSDDQIISAYKSNGLGTVLSLFEAEIIYISNAGDMSKRVHYLVSTGEYEHVENIIKSHIKEND